MKMAQTAQSNKKLVSRARGWNAEIGIRRFGCGTRFTRTRMEYLINQVFFN